MVTQSVEVRIAGTVADPGRIYRPMSVTHGRADVIVQADPPTASILWDGPDCPWKIGDTVEIWVTVTEAGAVYDDPVATYDDPEAVYDSDGSGGSQEFRRFLGSIAELSAQAWAGVVTGWEIEAVGRFARYGMEPVKVAATAVPAESDVDRVRRIGFQVGVIVTVLGDPGVTLASVDLDGDAMSLWHQVCESSGGLIWQSADGVITYETAAHRVSQGSPVGSLQSEVFDSELAWTSTVDDIINEVTVSWGPEDARVEATHQDSDSIAERWGLRHAQIDTMCAVEADAEQLALLVLARRAWPYYGVVNGLITADEPDLVSARLFSILDIGSPVLIPIPHEPGPTPAEPTPAVVEGWVETWGEDGHTIQMAFSDQRRWVHTMLRTYNDVNDETYAFWAAGDYLNVLVQEAA